jgi:hypothetical protein
MSISAGAIRPTGSQRQEHDMTEYLIAIYHPADFRPFSEDENTARDIDDLNRAMRAAGIIRFVGGLKPVAEAVSVRVAHGKEIVSDGPYLETKEHIGGFWVLELATGEEAVEWGKKAAAACRAPVEVRAFWSASDVERETGGAA